MLPYRLDTIQVYCPSSLGTRSFSLRYQIEVLRYGSSRLPFKSSPSFSQVYLSGGVPFALHLSLTEWDAGQALNALFKVSGSEKTGFPKKKRRSIKANTNRSRAPTSWFMAESNLGVKPVVHPPNTLALHLSVLYRKMGNFKQFIQC